MAERYPEIASAGGLAPLLIREFASAVSRPQGAALEVSTPGSPYWATAAASDRSAEVSCAVEQTRYLVSFWESSVLLANQEAPAIPPLVAGLAAWLVSGAPPSELARRVPGVRLAEGALAYEAGPGAYISDRWAALRARLAEGAARGDALDAALLPVAELAAAHPVLGQHLPYRSLSRFGVSRELAPDASELPLVYPQLDAPGRFTLCTYQGTPLAEGSADEVVSLLAKSLASGEAA